MKILAFGDSIRLNTGYGKVSQHVLGYLATQGHDITQIGWQHYEPPEKISVQYKDKIATITLVGPLTRDDFAMQTTILYANALKPDIIYNSNDYFTLSPFFKLRDTLLNPFTLVNYGIIDGPDCGRCYNSIISNINIPVVPSKYGYEQIKAINNNSLYIPHGVDTEIFRKYNNKEELKKKYCTEGLFVYGSVNRNIWRKWWPKLIEAISILKNKYKLQDICLYAVTDPVDPAGNDLFAWAKFYNLTISRDAGIPADIMLNPGHVNFVQNLTEQELAEVYNMFDVFVSASMSEGFGLPTIEAQACGVPCIMCNNSANTELVEGHGWLYNTVKNKDGSELLISPTIKDITYHYTVPDTTHMVELMYEAYNDRALLKKYALGSYEFAQQYDWKNILPSWNEIIIKTEQELQ